ncbi:hypothetical protein NIES267_42240 [Calothrix parasitica NIES-267]|uniref:Uncharacterized protein n=1 Tax=Calothrix parasitica NIES-267 TaxID=1973488 RepID=A0A1Z4LUH5_9CYAN|nr:hypothetical protein NIES267_42240 [Calothrix parasitica NIES-267]
MYTGNNQIRSQFGKLFNLSVGSTIENIPAFTRYKGETHYTFVLKNEWK